MIADANKIKLELTEDSFNDFLPAYLKNASRVYFTPIHIAEAAAFWLTEGGKKRVLDIGAGVGKFCIAGAIQSDSFFCGIEYRKSLVKIANEIIKSFEVKNVIVEHSNILQIDFSNFNAFYLFNPFFENLIYHKKLNDEVTLSGELYDCYLKYTGNQLSKAKKGTKLVTFHGNNFEVPNGYRKESEAFGGDLKLWIKK